MKKGSLGCTGLFSLLAIFSGTITVLTGGSDDVSTDILLILFFVCLGIGSLYFLTKNKNNNNTKNESIIKVESNKYLDDSYTTDAKEIKAKNSNEVNAMHEENTKGSDKLRDSDEEIDDESVIVEKEVVREVESEKLLKENELLRMKLDLKEQYIKEIEQKNNKENETTSFNDQLIQKEKINKDNESQEKESYMEDLEGIFRTPLKPVKKPSKEPKNSIDLSYTKARTITDTFVVLDFETTGLKYNENEIIQYGIVEYEKGKIINEHTEYFKPNTPISKRIERITGITNEFLQDKPTLGSSQLEYLHGLIRGKTLVAHNAPFDMKFLLYQFYLNGIQHEKFRVIDTLTFSRRLIDETPNHKLKTLKEHFDLDDGDSHNALNDCRATGNLLLLLMNR